MKRKQFIVFMTTMVILSLSACGNTEGTTQVLVNPATGQSTENTQESAQAQSTTEVTADENVMGTDTPGEAVVGEMLDHVLNWTGMQYFYNEDSNIADLTANEAIAMAAHAANQIQGGLEEDENYNLIVPQDVLNEMMVNYFGKTYDLSEYTNPEYSMVQVTEDGTVLLQQGDWGTIAPQYRIQSIEPDASTQGAYLVTVDYYAYDYEESREIDVHYIVTYQYQPCAESQFGYCITDMKASAPENGTVSNPKQ